MIARFISSPWRSGATALLVLALSACSSTQAPSEQAATGATTVAAPSPSSVPTVAATTSTVDVSTAEPAATVVQPPSAVPSEAPTTQAPEQSKLNLNKATAEQFLTIPDVGNRMVREFMEYRPYTSILQFRREIGKYVSTEQVAAYELHVFVPVDINQADAETLKQIPGVDDSIANELIASRPFASSADFLTKLRASLSPDQASAAAAYLSTP